MSILLVNNTKEQVSVNITIDNFSKKDSYYFYQVTEALTKVILFELNPQAIYESSKVKVIKLLPESISVLSTLNLKHKDSGVTE